MAEFSSFRIHGGDAGHAAGVETLDMNDLDSGAVVVRAAYSSVNYKDALAGMGRAPIVRKFPCVGGIDVAGEVIESDVEAFSPGDLVLATGCGLSETRDGGYSQIVRLDEDCLVPLPDGLSLAEAMGLGTAGFTAALCLWRLQQNGLGPEDGPIVVTGASGGVGMFAIDILAGAGYEVHAITGKVEEFDRLQRLGARQCISRHKLYWGQRPLESASWAGAIDTVGGEMLEGLTRVIKPWGAIASCGMAGGDELHTTVMPFIIRGISLLGINSAGCPMPLRRELWARLAGDWKPSHLDEIVVDEIGLADLPTTFAALLDGRHRGRTRVRLTDAG